MRYKINWDGLGVTASLACAIHCALLPLFLTSLPVFGFELIDNNGFEIMMIVIAAAIGFYSLFHGYRKHHHQVMPISLFVIGILFYVPNRYGIISNFGYCRRLFFLSLQLITLITSVQESQPLPRR